MKKLLVITSLIFIVATAFGGGIVTNSNQSAYWVRTLVRDAAIGPDAVYFNPAGLTKLKDGFHFSLSSQTIFQNKDITNTYEFLSPSTKKFEGDIKVPVFPSAYATWKANKFAVSFGFNPIGGGGGATYDIGLPMFESQIANLVPLIQSSLAPLDQGLSTPYGFDPAFRNVTGYGADIYFKGTSVFFGYQLGVTYQINDVFSAYLGGRFVTAKNTYKGHIRGVQITAAPNQAGVPSLYNLPAGSYLPGDYLRGVANAAGVTGMTQAMLLGTAGFIDEATADINVEAEEKGTGIAPILGLNISPNDKLNIGLKYEFITKLELKTTVKDDLGGGLFMNDSTVNSDIPAMLSVGVAYKVLPKLSATAGFHYYFDKSANYGKTSDLTGLEVDNDEVIDQNYYEIGVGLEYGISDMFLVSAGYLFAKPGVSKDYQSELSFALPSSTVGLGFGVNLTNKILVNVGGLYSIYKEEEKVTTDISTGYDYTNKFYKDNLILSIGIDFSF